MTTSTKPTATTQKPALVKLSRSLAPAMVPGIVAELGQNASRRFLEFFTANIRNRNTRRAYAIAVGQFMSWCEGRGLKLEQLEPMLVAAYIERLTLERSPSTVKQHLAAIRMLFDWLVVGQVVPFNPAASVRGPSHVVDEGKTPVLKAAEARALFDAIDVSHVVGLRDRALIAVMVYSFARVGAVVGLRVRDYYAQGHQVTFVLREKGGKHLKVPAHHKAVEYVDAYLVAAGIADERNAPLFRTSQGKTRVLTDRAMTTRDALKMVKRRAKAAGLPAEICNHSFRGTGITNYLENGGSLEDAQLIAGHRSPRTTKLYDRTKAQLKQEEIERVRI